MIDVTHHQHYGQWTFVSWDMPGMVGGGRTLEDSMDAAEHAYRQRLSATTSEHVPHEVARKRLRHRRADRLYARLGPRSDGQALAA